MKMKNNFKNEASSSKIEDLIAKQQQIKQTAQSYNNEDKNSAVASDLATVEQATKIQQQQPI